MTAAIRMIAMVSKKWMPDYDTLQSEIIADWQA
jgi:hypothetical protein